MYQTQLLNEETIQTRKRRIRAWESPNKISCGQRPLDNRKLVGLSGASMHESTCYLISQPR